MKRYRPIISNKDPVMLEDESGNYTSLTEYYTLHDRVVRAESQVAYLAAENERLRKAGDTVVAAYCVGDWNVERWKEYPVVRQWLDAKEGKESK